MRQEQYTSTRKVSFLTKTRFRGFSILEVVLTIAIFMIVFAGFTSTIIFSLQNLSDAGARARAIYLAEEGLEAVRNIRDDNYSNVTAGTHGLVFSSSQWSFGGASDAVDEFTRAITVQYVDATRKEIESQVTWNQSNSRVGSVSLVTYLTNWQAGTGKPIPIIPDATLDLSGPADGTEIALYSSGSSTYALLGRKSSSEKEFYVIDVSDPSSPVVIAELEIGSDVTDIAVVGSYAYLSTSHNSAELSVVNLTTPATPTVVGSLNLSGNQDAMTLVASGSNLFLGRANNSAGPELYSISISTPTSPSLLSSLEIGDSVWKIALEESGEYVYVANGNNSKEFIIANVSSPSSISQTALIDTSGTTDATAIVSYSTYVGLAMDDGNFYVVDVLTPSVPVIVSTAFDVGIKVNDLTMGADDEYIFAGSGTVSAEVAVIDVSDPTTPASYYSVDLSGNEAKGLIWDETLNRVFGGGTGNTEEFFVLIP